MTMPKIDEIKEFLTILRVFFTVAVAMMVAIGGGGLIGSYRSDNYDVIFYLGLFAEIVLMFTLVFIVKKIKIKTKEIGKL